MTLIYDPMWFHQATIGNGDIFASVGITLLWRRNGHGGVANHQPHHCLLNRLFGCRSKKTLKLRVTGRCAGNSPGTGEFPAQMASNAENVSIWWRHHETHCVWISGISSHTLALTRVKLYMTHKLLDFYFDNIQGRKRLGYVARRQPCVFTCLSVNRYISMGWCKKNVTPLLTHCSYVFLVLTHRFAFSCLGT